MFATADVVCVCLRLRVWMSCSQDVLHFMGFLHRSSKDELEGIVGHVFRVHSDLTFSSKPATDAGAPGAEDKARKFLMSNVHFNGGRVGGYRKDLDDASVQWADDFSALRSVDLPLQRVL